MAAPVDSCATRSSSRSPIACPDPPPIYRCGVRGRGKILDSIYRCGVGRARGRILDSSSLQEVSPPSRYASSMVLDRALGRILDRPSSRGEHRARKRQHCPPRIPRVAPCYIDISHGARDTKQCEAGGSTVSCMGHRYYEACSAIASSRVGSKSRFTFRHGWIRLGAKQSTWNYR